MEKLAIGTNDDRWKWSQGRKRRKRRRYWNGENVFFIIECLEQSGENQVIDPVNFLMGKQKKRFKTKEFWIKANRTQQLRVIGNDCVRKYEQSIRKRANRYAECRIDDKLVIHCFYVRLQEPCIFYILCTNERGRSKKSRKIWKKKEKTIIEKVWWW